MWISVRETLLDWISGSRAAILNPPPRRQANASPAAGLDERMRRLLNRLKGEALSAGGDRVDYARLAQSALYQQEYRALAAGLADFDPRQLTRREERLSFWINLYNALILDGVVALGVRRSVSERLGGLGFFRRAAYCVGGERLSADDIEHGILRANRGHPFLPGRQFAQGDRRLDWALEELDPRVHFTLNCASRSCPPVGVYYAAQIDAQLDLAAGNFIHQDAELTGGGLRISRIFHWYAADFGGREGMIAFLLRHLPAGDARRAALQGSPRLIHHPYDWGLNHV